MSVTVRTNRATNPSATSTTNYAAVAGTGGTAALSNQAGAGYSGNGFNRVTWSVATTSPSGGASYTQTGLSASTQYSHVVAVKASKAQTVNLTAQYQDNTATNVGAATTSTNVALTAGVWALLTVTATSGAAVDRVVLTAAAAGAGTNWANGDTLDIDAVLIEASSAAGAFFDGSFVNANSVMYAWTGAANASTSTATTYTPVITLVTIPTWDPCPRVEVTITDMTPTDNVVNIWRTADGRRQAIRGGRKLTINGSNFKTDYEVPFGRTVAYDLEVLSGLNAGAAADQKTTSIASECWAIQDPLNPATAIPLNVSRQDSTKPYLTRNAIRSLEYTAGVAVVPIMGSDEPVGLMGQRSIAGNVSFDMFTNFAQTTTNLRNLLRQAPLLLVRSNGVRNNGIPGLAYFTSARPAECPVTVGFGGTLTEWKLSGDLVAAPTMNVLVPIWTYGAVSALYSSYQAAQDALGGGTYLAALKNPTGT